MRRDKKNSREAEEKQKGGAADRKRGREERKRIREAHAEISFPPSPFLSSSLFRHYDSLWRHHSHSAFRSSSFPAEFLSVTPPASSTRPRSRARTPLWNQVREDFYLFTETKEMRERVNWLCLLLGILAADCAFEALEKQPADSTTPIILNSYPEVRQKQRGGGERRKPVKLSFLIVLFCFVLCSLD